jgi:tetratricopeptide (TPR) repeat protein
MWKVAARAVCERPWTGYGWESVAGAYGDAQEAYFAKGDYTATEAHVAGSPEYVFNEYLQVAMAWGVPVLVICLLVLVGGWCIAHRRKQYGLCGGLLSFGVFAFSSYPLQFPLFVFSLVLLWVGCILSCLPHQKRWGRVTAVILFLIALISGCLLYYHQQRKEEARDKWERCRVLYQSGAYSQAVESYAEHYEGMKLDARYLFEYGHALHKLHRNEESNIILQEALKVSSDPMILNIIGKNFQEMQQYKDAEHWLIRSTHRLPGRVYPYYLLAKLYQEAGDYFPSEKLDWAIRMVLETEPKVHSRAIDEMREEVKRIAKNVHPIERKLFGK